MCDLTIDSFIFRDAAPDDVSALAALHVQTFSETHGQGPNPPTHALRKWQWQELFKQETRDWFCLIIQNHQGELIGFAKGVRHMGGLPDFEGELNKIYLLRAYQRIGLGRRLMGHIARRFLTIGVRSMLFFGEAANPSNKFYEVLEGERLYTAMGDFHGGYGWRDLQKLVEICPVS